MSVPELRRLVLARCDILQAIVAFNYRYDEAKAFLASVRDEVPTAPAKRLRHFRDYLKEKIAEASTIFGLRTKPSVFYKWLRENSAPEGKVAYISRGTIDIYFRNFTAGLFPLREFPAHVLVPVDFSAESYEEGKVDYYLAEAALYEDMCVAYNQAHDLEDIFRQKDLDRAKVKAHRCAVRTAVLSAFYFVEAYLNGIAYDFVLEEGKSLPDRDGEMLLECDLKNKKERWVSFKDKAYQYPKIILRLQHPPVTESNCPELKTLLFESKEIRDAIVHQSPRPIPGNAGASKVRWMVALSLNDATPIVDAAIAYVKRVNNEVGRHGIKLGWLLPRGSDGKFPPESFL
jgi:hypothetical protein